MQTDPFKLIILEDEDDIRNGLATLVDWAALGFCVSATFKHGEAAMEYLRGHTIDALLTDICLGGTSGLDVAKWLSENQPNTRIVILSGYSDFSYAQQAMTYKVTKYLLKPIDIPELESTFQEIRNELCKTSMDQQRYRYANRYCMRSLLSLMLSNGQYRNEFSWLAYAAPEQFENDGGWFFAHLHTSSHKNDIDELFCRHFDSCAAFSLSAYYHNKGLYLLAIPHPQYSVDLDDFRSVLEQAIDLFVQQHRIILSPLSLMRLDSLADLEAYLQQNRISGENDAQIHQAVGYINDMDFGNLLALIPACDDEVLRMAGVLLLSRLSQLDAHLAEQTFPVDDGEYRRFSLESGDALQQHIRLIIQRFQQYISQTNNQIINRACLYIESCRGRKVSLAEVAEQVFVSPTYLSRLFKTQKNMNFKTYVSSLTLDAAKRILVSTDAKICDVSEQLGFKDIRHFYKFFSNGTGLTPTEYRKAHRREL